MIIKTQNLKVEIRLEFDPAQDITFVWEDISNEKNEAVSTELKAWYHGDIDNVKFEDLDIFTLKAIY